MLLKFLYNYNYYIDIFSFSDKYLDSRSREYIPSQLNLRWIFFKYGCAFYAHRGGRTLNGDYLKEKILEKYKSIEQFAFLNGYSYTTVYRWINGKCDIKLCVLKELRTHLDIDILKLLD